MPRPDPQPRLEGWTTRDSDAEGIGEVLQDEAGEVVAYLPACFNVDYGPLLRAVPALVKIVARFADQPVSEDAPCHLGICEMERCARCREIIAARELLRGAGVRHA